MGESTKAILQLTLIVAVIATICVWLLDNPNAITWILRFGAPLLAVAALGILLVLQARVDHVPDYLRKLAGSYFYQDGFGFSFAMQAEEGVACLMAYFQNQYDRPCSARIAVRPPTGWLGTRKQTYFFDIECEPAAFGTARLPIALPYELQGKRQLFELGLTVRFPEGKGNRLRFYDGIFVRTNCEFRNPVATSMTVLGALGGALVVSTPASITIDLPQHVAEEVPPNLVCEIRTLWKLGDPELPVGG